MSIRNPGAVYRSNFPKKHRQIAAANEAARDKAIAAMQVLAESLVPGSDAYGTHHHSGAVYMSGVKVPHGVDVDVPVGMRWDTKARGGARVLVPAKKTEEGRALVKQMDALNHAPESLGAVSKILTVTDGANSWFASAVVEVIDDDVYATYLHPLDDRHRGARRSDREIVAADEGWSEIPLSEFYAAREKASSQAAV